MMDTLRLTEYCKSLKQRYEPNNRVLFVQLPQLIFKSFNPEIARKRGYYAFPPAGLQYLYESIKTRDIDIKILDLNLELLKKVTEDEAFDHMQWLRILEDCIEGFDPFIIGISCMYDSGIQSLMQILEFLKKHDRSVVITGGVIPTYESENLLLRNLCHFVIKGEGENRINHLLGLLIEEDQEFAPTDGICYNYQDGYSETEGEEQDVVIDSDMIDSYSLVEIEKYHEYGSLNPFSRMAGIDSSPFAAIQFSRGCRGSCTFCSVRDFIGSGIHKRPVDKVLAEMEFLVNKHGIKHFEWLDDDLLFFKGDFKHLLESVIDKRWDITWSANNGLIATSIDEGLMQLMKDSGCIGFKIGIETGNPEMLKKIQKPASLDTFRNVAHITEKYPEIFVGGNFMLGFPNEKFSQMMDSFRFFLELNLDWGAFTICQAIRGATAFSDFEDYFDTQIESGGDNAKNFIPARESSREEICARTDILKGLDLFKINPDSVPDEEQIREIWFTFNLVGNFINNKNLKPGGRVEKFISWVEMAQVAYPTNPYMNLFLSFAHIIKGDMAVAINCYKEAVLSSKSSYWQGRFDSFGLNKIMNDFPRTQEEVFEAMERLREYSSVSHLVG